MTLILAFGAGVFVGAAGLAVLAALIHSSEISRIEEAEARRVNR